MRDAARFLFGSFPSQVLFEKSHHSLHPDLLLQSLMENLPVSSGAPRAAAQSVINRSGVPLSPSFIHLIYLLNRAVPLAQVRHVPAGNALYASGAVKEQCAS